MALNLRKRVLHVINLRNLELTLKISGTLWSMNPERAKWKSWRSWWCASGYSACCTPFPRLSRSPATSMNFSIKNRGSGVGWQEIAGKSSFFLLVSFFKLQKQGRVPSKAARGMSRMPLITMVLIFWVAWKRLLLSWGFSSLAGVLWCSISASPCSHPLGRSGSYDVPCFSQLLGLTENVWLSSLQNKANNAEFEYLWPQRRMTLDDWNWIFVFIFDDLLTVETLLYCYISISVFYNFLGFTSAGIVLNFEFMF